MRQTAVTIGNRAAPAQIAAALVVMLGCASLAGWLLGIQPLTSLIPGAAEMKANTAAGMVSSGVALFLLSKRRSGGLDRFAQALGTLVLLVGTATLLEYLQGRGYGIDELLFADKAGAYNVFRGRMSPFTATGFVAASAALIMVPHRRLYGIAQWCAGGALLVGAVSLLGYLWGAGEIITDRWLPPVALNTALCFALLGAGILLTLRSARSRHGRPIAALAGVEIRILAGFIVSFSLLLIGGAYTYRATEQFADSLHWIAHSQEVRADVASLYGSLAGAEIALRDYLLTKDDVHLAGYRRLAADVNGYLAAVQALTVDNAVQRHNLAVLRPTVNGRLATMTNTLTAFAHFGLPAARAVIAITRNTNATEDVRAQTAVIDEEEVRLLTQRQREAANVRVATLLSLFATLTVGSALFIALFRGVHREMLARRDAENALRASDRYSRSVLDSSPDCLCVLTLDGHVSQMTAHGRQLMEIDDFATVQNFDWLKAWRGADRAAAEAALAEARNDVDARFQGFCPTQKGTPKWWDVIVMPMRGADGRPESLLTVSRDITEDKRRETELRETNHFLDSLFESLPVMVVIKDAVTLRVVRCNSAFGRTLGIPSEAVKGRTAEDLFDADEAARIVAQDRETLTAGRLLDAAEQSIMIPGQGLRVFSTMKLPIDEDGEPRYLMAISVDITARKLSEDAIRELNAALEVKASQLESSNHELESFSYSVSHDLRAPLRAIDGFALMIEEDFSTAIGPEGRRYLAVIRENSRRMGDLIDDLLAFSRLGRLPVNAHEFNVESLVREVIEELLGAEDLKMGGPVRVRPTIEIGTLPPVRGDRGLLKQVWINLLSNAIKYSGKSHAPRIEVQGRVEELENVYSIKDNGVGFSMDYVEKLFGVFQRLHRADEFSGTGVGLAIVHRVISRHGGRVWAEGRIDDGATFSFALPREGI